MTPGWNAHQGVENVHTLCAGKPDSDDRGNNIALWEGLRSWNALFNELLLCPFCSQHQILKKFAGIMNMSCMSHLWNLSISSVVIFKLCRETRLPSRVHCQTLFSPLNPVPETCAAFAIYSIPKCIKGNDLSRLVFFCPTIKRMACQKLLQYSCYVLILLKLKTGSGKIAV